MFMIHGLTWLDQRLASREIVGHAKSTIVWQCHAHVSASCNQRWQSSYHREAVGGRGCFTNQASLHLLVACLPVLNVLSCHLHSVHCMPVDRLVLLELCILAALAWQGLRRGPQQQSHAPPGLHWEAQVYGIQYIFCIMHILHIFNHQLQKNLRFQSFPNNLSKMTCTLLSVATLEKPESRSQDQLGPNTRKYCSRKMCRGTTLATNNA